METVDTTHVLPEPPKRELKADAAGGILRELEPATARASQQILDSADFSSHWEETRYLPAGKFSMSFTNIDGNVASLTIQLEP